MKFCCEKFEVKVKLPSTTAPNIRIVSFLPKPPYWEKPINGFCLTMGYEKFNIELPLMMISYCPYCGTKLTDFYSKSEFINEVEGETFG